MTIVFKQALQSAAERLTPRHPCRLARLRSPTLDSHCNVSAPEPSARAQRGVWKNGRCEEGGKGGVAAAHVHHSVPGPPPPQTPLPGNGKHNPPRVVLLSLFAPCSCSVVLPLTTAPQKRPQTSTLLQSTQMQKCGSVHQGSRLTSCACCTLNLAGPSPALPWQLH